MANKRNYEWPQASSWDGYFTQDKVGGTTQRVDPSLVFDRLRAEGFINEEYVDNTISSAVQNLQTELDAKQDAFTKVDEGASIAGSTATVSIEQGDFYIVDLSEETSITAIEIELTNNAEAAFPLWWFKIESGSAATLSVKIGAVAVGWIGSAITNIVLGKTVEINVVDNVACGGELV